MNELSWKIVLLLALVFVGICLLMALKLPAVEGSGVALLTLIIGGILGVAGPHVKNQIASSDPAPAPTVATVVVTPADPAKP